MNTKHLSENLGGLAHCDESSEQDEPARAKGFQVASKQVPANDQIVEWLRVTESVDRIRDLLVRTPESDVTSPSEAVADSVKALAAQLRAIFVNEESGGFIADLYDTAPQLSDGISQLKEERIRLLGILDDMSQLLQSPVGPETSGSRIRQLFQQFVGLLAHHEQSEDLLIQRTAFDDFGVID